MARQIIGGPFFSAEVTARTDPFGVRYEFIHDTNLQLTKVANPQGLEWSYVYDPAGHLISETDFDGRAHTYRRRIGTGI
ncbi:YD repeat-containing protein [Streptomyces yunnanensis]|uniref:YD repeat-containing protein n=1 Tax=Streptomyces yunnanensis TaxID=156453 RepID=A0A9X8QYD3_9ACTN|nr:YD repeat-containing protein [Streptomyces yunnanensis]